MKRRANHKKLKLGKLNTKYLKHGKNERTRRHEGGQKIYRLRETETINTLSDDEGSGNSWSEQDVMRRGKQNLAH